MVKDPSRVVVVTKSYAGPSKRTRLKAKQQNSATISNIVFESQPTVTNASADHGKSGNAVLLEVTEISTLCNNAAHNALVDLQGRIEALTKKAQSQDVSIAKKEVEVAQAKAC